MLVSKLLQTNEMSYTVRVFKIGVQITNATAVKIAGKKQIQMNEQKKLR